MQKTRDRRAEQEEGRRSAGCYRMEAARSRRQKVLVEDRDQMSSPQPTAAAAAAVA